MCLSLMHKAPYDMSDSYYPYKYLIYFVAAFMSFYLTQVVILNRLVSIGSVYVTGGCVVYFLSPLVVDVVAEVYGYNIAKKMLWCGLFGLLFIGIVVYIVLRLPPVPFWAQVTKAYEIALGSLPRTAFIGSVVIFIGQVINAFLISKWRVLTKGRYFWLRSVSSSVIGDITTLVLANVGIFSGRMTIHNVTYLILPQIVALVICSAVGAIPASFLAKFVAKAEGLNDYDIGVHFNPFKIHDKVDDHT